MNIGIAKPFIGDAEKQAVMEVLNDKDGTYSSLTSVLGPKPGLPFEPRTRQERVNGKRGATAA